MKRLANWLYMFWTAIITMLAIGLLPVTNAQTTQGTAQDVAREIINEVKEEEKESLLLGNMSMLGLYADNRANGIPNYITEDVILASYALILQQTQIEVEQGTAFGLLSDITLGLQTSLASFPQNEAVKANRDYIAVLRSLLLGRSSLAHAGNQKRAAEELLLIQESAGVSRSPLWGVQVDYSQFRPRGYYTANEELARYFSAVRYANSILFAVQPSKSTGVSPKMAGRMIEQAYTLLSSIASDPALLATYNRFNSLFDWSIGTADDLTFVDLELLGMRNIGKSLKIVSEQLLNYARKNGRQPRIIQGIVNKTALEKGLSVADVMTGWRLIPSRYTADSEVFQRLVFDQVGEYQKQCNKCGTPFGAAMIGGKVVKGFPSSLELMELLGSDAAAKRLKAMDQTSFEGYSAAHDSAQTALTNATGLDGKHLQFMGEMMAVEPTSADRRLTSMLGLWTWLKYTKNLYSKQSYTVSAKSFNMNPPRPGATIEPAVELYSSMLALVKLHQKTQQSSLWTEFESVLQSIIPIAGKVKASKSLNKEEESALNKLDLVLSKLIGVGDEPIVVDVHTTPATGQIMYSGLGWARGVKPGWQPDSNARGALFSHYEFKAPMEKRMTNEDWLVYLEELSPSQ